MSPPRLVSLIGLGFGDCGKGRFIDFLARELAAHTVVRFNGGAQAGHNVVLPDGRHHTFSQFGSASFVPGVFSLLTSPVVVHPTALLVEHDALRRAGVADGLQRLLIDARCRITTPFHQAAGRLREKRRGAAAHGSCGVGVGETVRHALAQPAQVLHYGELTSPCRVLDKLEATRLALQAEFDDDDGDAESGVLGDAGIARRWLSAIEPLVRRVPPADADTVARRLGQAGTVLFEGAQGVLLDEWHGFHPHTTWSSTGRAAVEAVVADAGLDEPVQHLGVLRSYLTRHGPGPLPTEDAALDLLPEPHNASGGWQGRFRRGHADGVLLRYALDAAGPFDGLLLSHLDAFDRGLAWRWCEGYEAAPDADDGRLAVRDANGRVTRLRPGPGRDLDHATRLTALLGRARPAYRRLADAEDFIRCVEAAAACRVRFTSRGPTHADVQGLNRP
jgi:adenylosuccinate synthase